MKFLVMMFAFYIVMFLWLEGIIVLCSILLSTVDSLCPWKGPHAVDNIMPNVLERSLVDAYRIILVQSLVYTCLLVMFCSNKSRTRPTFTSPTSRATYRRRI